MFNILDVVFTILVYACVTKLKTLKMQNMFFDVLNAICDSNDTKSVPNKHVDPSVKANTSKGENFVPPTEALSKMFQVIVPMNDLNDIEDGE
jgi:hypothetical protein